MEPLIIIAGPTAVGKSELAVRVAKKYGGSIISCDSMQVYKGMDIGTAKIKSDEREGIPHYLLDVLDPSEDFNIVLFKQMATKAIEEIRLAGRIPIMVGGTGFYIQSVLYDIDFDECIDDPDYRHSLWALIDEKGDEHVHKMLEDIDPVAASSISVKDHKRIVRALEYNHQTGGLISEHNEENRARTSRYDHCFFVLTDERSRIYDRINSRVDRMIEDGLVDEVRTLLAGGLGRTNIS
ncbi:MAG: tRNA (adenosine(37)-N6)-dimethylallyltransferase MiaA, partial [Lachnospiraceae bacterium]|nr:tRNA (adenosine(37)-N6)-dimethylallyltransferase MiaA [Lachnospiraceae bacterium]